MPSRKQKNRKPRGYYENNDNIIKEILRRLELGLDLNANSVIKDDGGLYRVAYYRFGSWEKALKIAGIDYNESRKNKSWSKEKIIKEIMNRVEQNLRIDGATLQKEIQSLYRACKNHFGSLEKAIEACGLVYDEIRLNNRWSEEKIISELSKRYKENLPMSREDLTKDNLSLLQASEVYFGNYKNAIEAIGIDYGEVRNYKSWNAEKVINEIVLRYNSGKPMSISKIMLDDCSLYGACLNLFGSYKRAIIAANINYDEIREDKETLKVYGHKFQEIVEEIFNELKISYSKGFNFELRPDFRLSHDRWIDAKLSEWSIYQCDTIDKYEPKCKSLTIIYLRGKKFNDTMITNKTRLISIYKFIKQLPNHTQRYYNQLLDKLLQEVQYL